MNLSINQNNKPSFGLTVKYGSSNKEITTTMNAFLNSDPRCANQINDLVKKLNQLGSAKDTVYFTAKDMSSNGYLNKIGLTLRQPKSKEKVSTELILRDEMACCAKDDSSDSNQSITKKLQNLYNDFIVIIKK